MRHPLDLNMPLQLGRQLITVFHCSHILLKIRCFLKLNDLLCQSLFLIPLCHGKLRLKRLILIGNINQRVQTFICSFERLVNRLIRTVLYDLFSVQGLISGFFLIFGFVILSFFLSYGHQDLVKLRTKLCNPVSVKLLKRFLWILDDPTSYILTFQQRFGLIYHLVKGIFLLLFFRRQFLFLRFGGAKFLHLTNIIADASFTALHKSLLKFVRCLYDLLVIILDKTVKT